MKISSEADMAEAIVSAKTGLRILGGGTRPVGNPVAGDVVLDTSGMAGITLYEPGALTIVAKAGTPLAEVDALLAAEGQRLAFEPMDHRKILGTSGVPTIGAVAAMNNSGPRRVQAGACRDYLLGLRFVNGSGDIVKNGGRVMKNVTGYDLVKLLSGSFGTLGVISEVALKVLPVPEMQAVLKIGGLTDSAAVDALSQALGSPFDVTAAAHLPISEDGAPLTLIRLEGFETSVLYRARKLQASLESFGEVQIETDQHHVGQMWQAVRDVKSFQDRDGDIWRLSVKPTDGPVIGAVLKDKLAAELVYDWGGGLLWVLVPVGADVRAVLGNIKGHATLIRAADDTKARLGVFHRNGPVLNKIADELRAKFDPRGILNPGIITPKTGL